MRSHTIFPSCFTLILAACFLPACSNGHQLHSLTITPATADAQSSSTGQVQFTAMGSYGGSGQPMAVNALWWNSTPWVFAPTPPNGINIDANGMATCTILTGTFTLWATAPRDQTVPLSKMSKNTSQLTATATLTCP